MPFVRPYMNDSNCCLHLPFITRYEKGDLSGQFFNKAINSVDIIPRVLAVVRKARSLHIPPSDNENSNPSQGPEEPPFVMLCQSEPGMDGYFDIVRGGVLAALLDETLNLCAETYRVLVSDEWEHSNTA